MKNIAAALLKVQQGLDPIHKGKQGYGYKYADLPAVMNNVLDALNAEGIVVIQAPCQTDKQAAAINTRLIHASSGEEISGVIEVPYGEVAKMSVAQCYGSSMTYARRYALVSMVGVVVEDDDAASAGKRTETLQEPPADRKAYNWATSYAQLRALEADKVGLDGENSAMIAAAMKYPSARSILVKAGVPE